MNGLMILHHRETPEELVGYLIVTGIWFGTDQLLKKSKAPREAREIIPWVISVIAFFIIFTKRN